MEAISAIAILLFGLVPGLYMVIQYNSLVALRSRVRASWSEIDTELKHRYGLISRLVEIVRSHAPQERGAIENVIALRDRCAANHGSARSRSSDEAQFVSGLQTLLARAEAYTELKADTPFQNLQRELVDAENRIQAARRSYNGNVRASRNKCERFPSSVVAGMFGFQRASFFEVDAAIPDPSTISSEL